MSKVLEKLLAVQMELKAPKNQRNNFGGYNYRSCEDILEAVKPLCLKHECLVTISDDILNVGTRYYIKATARFSCLESGESVENTAYAREPESKKGSDESQITGAASSYARKYALNGLFCIDDTKDSDSVEYQKAARNVPSKPAEPPKDVQCVVCGSIINGAQKGGKTITGAQIAAQTGGMCLKCYKEANK